jgi:2-hydroxychromene-2-carboxylate isomerase
MSLEVFFDYSSPFSYLASTQVERIARARSASLLWKPFLLGALFKEIGAPLVPIAAMPEAKRRYLVEDMARWAAHWGVPFRFPSRFPLRTVKPLRMTLLSPHAVRPALLHRLMRLCWVDDGDPDDDAQLLACTADSGAPPSLVERTRTPDAKLQLKKATDEAVARGVPGAPTFFVGETMFWGQDRLVFVEKALDGWKPRMG